MRELDARRRATRLAMVLALAGGAGCADLRRPASTAVTADSSAGELAFRWAGPGGAALVVPVRINGAEPVDLVLDTGATLTCVDSALTRELALPEQRAVRGSAVGVGGSGQVRLYRVDSLQLGTAVARGLTVCALDLQALRAIAPEVRGLLGLNVLRGFQVTLDFERQVVALVPSGG
jgi:predicted aspartyl protease